MPSLPLHLGPVALAAFIVTAPFAHAATERVVYSFKGGSDGAGPLAALLKVGGTLYGTTLSGGAAGCQCGTVFKLTKAGAETVLYAFQGGLDGDAPFAPLIYVGGTLYGTTYNGGGSDACQSVCGTVFAITPAGAETVVYRFPESGTYGINPRTSLVNLKGTLYGTAFGEGPNRSGLVFSVTPAGALTIVYAFKGGSDGVAPSGLIKAGGELYGTTAGGGSANCTGGCGTVFAVTPTGAEKVVYTFKGGSDGYSPTGLIKVGDVFYGTTGAGGGTGCQNIGCGTVFKVTKAGKETVLYAFQGGSDGESPTAGPINVGGTLYGTTGSGGATNRGTVFSVTPAGVKTVLWSFQAGGDGSGPYAALINVGGTLYGTTGSGGANEQGTVFAVTP